MKRALTGGIVAISVVFFTSGASAMSLSELRERQEYIQHLRNEIEVAQLEAEYTQAVDQRQTVEDEIARTYLVRVSGLAGERRARLIYQGSPTTVVKGDELIPGWVVRDISKRRISLLKKKEGEVRDLPLRSVPTETLEDYIGEGFETSGNEETASDNYDLPDEEIPPGP